MGAFSPSFGHSCGKSTQVPLHEQLTQQSWLFQSSLIVPNQGKSRYFLNQHARQSTTQILYHFSHVFAFPDPKQSACRALHELALLAVLGCAPDTGQCERALATEAKKTGAFLRALRLTDYETIILAPAPRGFVRRRPVLIRGRADYH